MALKRTADSTAGNRTAGSLRADPIGVSNGDISGISCRFDIPGFDDETGSAAFGGHGAGNGARPDLSCCRMEFGIAANITNFQCSALAPYFRITADVARFYGSALSDDCSVALDVRSEEH